MAVAIKHHPPTQVEHDWGAQVSAPSTPLSNISPPHSKGVSSTKADRMVPTQETDSPPPQGCDCIPHRGWQEEPGVVSDLDIPTVIFHLVYGHITYDLICNHIFNLSFAFLFLWNRSNFIRMMSPGMSCMVLVALS